MAKGNRRRGRHARRRGNGTGYQTARRNSSQDPHSLSRSLHLETLEDRRLLAVFEVVNTADLIEIDGEIEVVAGSLRDAIIRANETEEFDTIVFTGPAFEQPTAIGLQSDDENFGQLEITNSVEIVGPGAAKLNIIAASGRRVFFVNDAADDNSIQVSIGGITLFGSGTIAGDDEEGFGGIIHNSENLTLAAVDVQDGVAPSGGGGIYHANGRLSVDGSLIRDNTSFRNGGGLQIGQPGAMGTFPLASIVNSTITGNQALGFPAEMNAPTGYGGGLVNFAGETDLTQSTIYGNSAATDGGGIASQGFDPELDDMGMPTVMEGDTTTNIGSSIIAGNTAPGDAGPAPNDVASIGMTEGADMEEPMPFDPQINSAGFNLFGEVTSPAMSANMTITLPLDHANDLMIEDPTTIFIDNGDEENPVAVLDDYGGDLRVFLPDPNKTGGMMVIDGGNPDNVAGAFDQRGRHFTRRFSTDETLPEPIMDIGAAEAQDGLFVVDSLIDESDGEYRVLDFSLREAIEFSEKNPNRDTISFSQEVRTQADPNPFTAAPTIVLTEGELAITQGVDIQGPTFQLEVDGDLSTRIFNVDDGSADTAIEVSISDLSLFDGGGVVNGGAIINSENLTLNRMYIRTSAAALNGGGLYIQGGDVTVDSSTFANNFTANNGGGIYVAADAGVVDIVNTTLSENSSANRGAGLANLGTDTSVRHSTITLNNSASTRGSGVANLSGGLLTVYSSIVAQNANNDIEFFGGDVTDITSGGYNLVGIGNAAGVFFGGAPGDLSGVLDPKLAPLVFTGGPTPTHRVLGDSPAVDAGNPADTAGTGSVPEFDQRGGPQFARVFDGDLDGTDQIDIGSYELQEVTYTVDTANDENNGDTSVGNLSLREAINIANASISPLPERIVFDPALDGETIFLLANVVDSTPDVQITGPLEIIGTNITISGAGLGGFPMFTVNDADDATNVPVTFADFAFTDGSGRVVVSTEDVELDSIIATSNTGVALHTLGTLTIKTSVLTGNIAPDSGGAVSVTDGNLVIEGDIAGGYGYTLITGNETTSSTGHGGGISFTDSTTDGRLLSLNKVIVSGNRAPQGDADGGGVYVVGNGVAGMRTEATLIDSVVSGNTTTGSNSEGSGVFAKDADVTLTGTIVSLNSSSGTNSRGGGIYLNGGSLTINNSALNSSLITQNRTFGNNASGAGIANIGGDVTLNQATVSQNMTYGSNTNGAGIYSSGGNLTVNGSSILQNSSDVAGFKGGGIYTLNDLASGNKTSIVNSTISGNTAKVRGGGVYNAGGLVEILHSTITQNSVPYFASGGGVASLGNSTTTRTEVGSSIIAGNVTSLDPINTNSDIDVVGGLSTSIVSLGYNIVGKGLAAALNEFAELGDQTNIADPGLGPLTFNGGPTLTHALLPTSPAINAGDPNAVAGVGGVPEFDQRGDGFARVFGGLRIDVGAFESELAPIVTGPAGDFDGDDDVDGSDFLAWQIGFGIAAGAGTSDGDANADGAVNGLDLGIWTTNYGSADSGPSGVALAALQSSSEPSAPAAVLSASELSTGMVYESPTDSSEVTENAVNAYAAAETVVVRDQLFASLAQRGDYRPPVSADGVTDETSDDHLEVSVEDQVFASLGA